MFIRTGRIQYILLSLILTGFIIFGRSFINLWAGEGYQEAYLYALMFFIPLTVPLIQNMGIIILQARNQMKFRSLLYIVIAVVSLVSSFPLAKYYGGMGCAISTAGALVLGQIIIMNIYYQRKQHINIIRFWKEISNMSLVPIAFISIYLVFQAEIDIYTTSFMNFTIGIVAFLSLYVPLFWKLSMNRSEKELFMQPVLKVLKRN